MGDVIIIQEELPVALYPDKPYDRDGCYSGIIQIWIKNCSLL